MALLIIDGYNVMHAWKSLRQAMEVNLEWGREVFISVLSRYSDFTGERIKVVFDGKGAWQQNSEDYSGVEVIFSTRGMSADSFIERCVYQETDRQRVRVVTSDRILQMMVRGMGAWCISPEELEEKIKKVDEGRELGRRLGKCGR